jgi:hypothetical protein
VTGAVVAKAALLLYAVWTVASDLALIALVAWNWLS